MIRITEYAQVCGFTLTKIGHYYSLKEHDSVRIDDERNCFWRNSVFQRGTKGHAGSVIDFAMEFENYPTAKDAVHAIAMRYNLSPDKDFIPPKARLPKNSTLTTGMHKQNSKALVLPEKNSNANSVIRYLCDVRMLDRSLVDSFIERELLYQDKRNNCVFVSPDKTFACLRSTGEKKFVCDLEGSNYDNCFFLLDDKVVSPYSIIVTESVIDMMSVMTYIQLRPWFLGKYKDKSYLALSGTNKMYSLYNHLNTYPSIQNIIFALDHDAAGKTAVSKSVDSLQEKGFKGNVLFAYPPTGKDWNDCVVQSSRKKT